MRSKVVKEALSHLGSSTVCFLATCDGGQPRVRTMMLHRYDDGFFFVTGTRDAKVMEAVKNPRVEVCVLLGEGEDTGSVRLTGSVEVVYNEDVKASVFGCAGYAEAVWQTPENPDYTLLKFKPEKLQYMPVGTMDVHRADLA